MNLSGSESYTVVVADGSFPQHEIPLSYLGNAERIVACDGSVSNLILAGIEPVAIVGDMDSIDEDLANRYADRLFKDENQDTNDLTKAVNWCAGMGYNNIVIVGGTGKREDHTIGNISLLTEYAKMVNVMMVTDTGLFYPLLKGSEISCLSGQQISIFSIDTNTEVTSSGLKYPLSGTKINNWWCATLNEALGSSFSLSFLNGRIIVFLKFA